MMPFHLITQNGKSVFSMWLTDSRDLSKKMGNILKTVEMFMMLLTSKVKQQAALGHFTFDFCKRSFCIIFQNIMLEFCILVKLMYKYCRNKIHQI